MAAKKLSGALQAVKGSRSIREAARMYGVGKSTVADIDESPLQYGRRPLQPLRMQRSTD